MNEIFTLELLLTRNCNQKCYYCSYWKDSKNYMPYVDENYILYIIDLFSKRLNGVKFRISLSGGEPGLIKNLPSIIALLKNNHKVNEVHLNSNGLVRINFPDVINYVDKYYEHLVLDIIPPFSICKFYNLPFLYKNNSINVIILTKNAIKSLEVSFKNFRESNMINRNFWYKIMNFKNINNKLPKENYFVKLLNLKLHDTYNSGMFRNFRSYQKFKNICYKNSHTPVVDIQMKKFLHCSINYQLAEKFDVNKTTIDLFFNRQLLYNRPDYCKFCNTPNPFCMFRVGNGQ